jgi:hypothetical protein
MTINFKLMASLLIAGLFVLVISACGNSQITHSYVDPVLKKLDLDGVLVVAVTKKQSARVEFEDAFTQALARRGVRAQASHTLVPSAKATAEEVIAAAKKASLETILVARYLGESSEEVYHPGTIYYDIAPAYGAGYHGGFGGYYGRAYEVAYQQPVWTANVTHTVVSDLYITQTSEHIWQAVSETIKASSTNKLRNDAINSLIGDLKDQGLLD